MPPDLRAQAKGPLMVASQLKRFVSLNGHVPRGTEGTERAHQKNPNQIAKGGSIISSFTCSCPVLSILFMLLIYSPAAVGCVSFVVLFLRRRPCGLSNKCALALHWLFRAHAIGRVIR